jgi:hypothetical protein
MPTWRGNTYRFTVTAATAAAGDTYTNNGQTFTVTDAIAGGTVLYCFGTGAPTATGNLVRATGAGTDPIVFSAFTGPNTNWGTPSNWLENAIPTTTTTAVFDAQSRDCTVNASNRPCSDFTTTNYTNTITFTFDVEVNGTTTLGAGMLFAGTGFINIRFTANSQTRTLDVATGLTVPRLAYGSAVSLTGSTISLTRSTTVTNLTNNNGTASTFQITGTFTLTLSGGTLTHTSTGRTVLSSTTILDFSGTCTATGGNFSGGTIRTLSGSSLTVTGNWSYGSAGTIDFSLGTVNFGTTRFQQNAALTLNFPASVGSFYDYGGSPSALTLQSDVVVSRDYIIDNAIASHTINGAFKFIVQGKASINGGATISGTATISFEGTSNNGAIVISTAGTVIFTIATINIQKSTATFTLDNSTRVLRISSANYTVTSGTIINTTSTLEFSGTQTITHTVAATYFNITIVGATPTKTLSGNIWNIAGTLTVNATAAFAGTIGWTAATFSSIPTTTTTITIQNGVTYTVTGSLVMQGNSPTSAILFFTSNSPTVRAIFTLDNGASQFVYFVRATRIDSGAGQTIWDVPGTISPLLTDTINWNPGSRPAPIAYSFIS